MKRLQIGRIVALTWVVIAIGVTLMIGPSLGWRGWGWLLAHHLLCAVGASHELLRSRSA